jgi:hypothetical protein
VCVDRAHMYRVRLFWLFQYVHLSDLSDLAAKISTYEELLELLDEDELDDEEQELDEDACTTNSGSYAFP